MEVLSEAPQLSSFTSLAEYQSTTPASFSNPAVLHYYSDRCQLLVEDRELTDAPALSNLVHKASAPTQSNDGSANGHAEDEIPQTTLENIDVFVTSSKLLLWSTTGNTGVSIPYPTISLHAIQTLPAPAAAETTSKGVYLQLIPSIEQSSDDDEPPDTIAVTIVPTASEVPQPGADVTAEDDAIAGENLPERTPVQALFKALSSCSDLNPDPMDLDDEEEGGSRLMQAGLAMPGTSDGSLPPPMPGSGGWITAENMHEFVDEDGNFIEGDDADEETEELGPGAGTVRQREDDPSNGKGADDEAKWQRTS